MPLSVFRACLSVLASGLILGSCMSEPEGRRPVANNGTSSGVFRVSLENGGGASIAGKVFNGVQPSALAWTEVAKSGACVLSKPKAPFCDGGCGSGGLCVSDGVCKPFPKAVSVGKVTVTGVKTKAGAAAFSMEPGFGTVYQPAVGTSLEPSPFAEGDAVAIAAAGDTAVGPFTVSAKGIVRLALAADSIVLADAKPVLLKWAAPAKDVGSKVHVYLDISHHGGTKGKIECEGPDNGSLEIAATLVDQLKALGVSGFPTVEATRMNVGKNEAAGVELILESLIVRNVGIPGLISCDEDNPCPSGKTCQQDMQCK